ncbi:MAG: peptidylprolyl isomerase [Gemmatimonadota bacterium]|nr:peptidylprolyl isomerase [Gemmatimonadota bacterium]
MLSLAAACGDSGQTTEGPVVMMETTEGTLRIELYPEEAPITVENFLAYVDSGFYDGTVFHRIVPGFVIQGGGFTADMEQKETRDPITNESDNGLRNLRGTLSMARLPAAHTATSQFFVNLVDNPALDHGGRPGATWGYAVFGRVIEGMDVVDAIASAPTTTAGGMADVPVEPVRIERAWRADPSG